jgi:hypothetical protein
MDVYWRVKGFRSSTSNTQLDALDAFAYDAEMLKAEGKAESEEVIKIELAEQTNQVAWLGSIASLGQQGDLRARGSDLSLASPSSALVSILNVNSSLATSTSKYKYGCSNLLQKYNLPLNLRLPHEPVNHLTLRNTDL